VFGFIATLCHCLHQVSRAVKTGGDTVDSTAAHRTDYFHRLHHCIADSGDRGFEARGFGQGETRPKYANLRPEICSSTGETRARKIVGSAQISCLALGVSGLP